MTTAARDGARAAPDQVRSTELRRDAEGVVRHGSEWLQLWADPDSLRSAAARARDLAAARAEASAQRGVAAALRAVAGTDIAVGFGAGEPGLHDGRADLPPPGRPPAPYLLAVTRGAADTIAVRLRHHDAALHAHLAPAGAEPHALFAALEQVRCEALAARHLPGLLPNLTAWSAWHLERLGLSQALLPADLPLHEAMAVVLRDRLTTGSGEFPSLGLQLWDRWLRRHLSSHIAALATALHDQRHFAGAALAFITALRTEIDRPDATPPVPAAKPQAGAETEHAPRIAAPSPEEHADEAPAARPRPQQVPSAPTAYRAFTTAHDRVVTPAELCDADQLGRLRATLDAETGPLRSLLSRLANQLQRRLLAQQRSTWDFDLDDGLLDAARLDRVVVTPGAALSFKQEREAAFRDTVVTLLLDCSGSMRGRPILLAAIAADIVARALERCGVACEVLGFTTADFTGGRSAADWVRAGRPKLPGRLGDLRHIVVKAADTSWRAVRPGFGALLLPGLLRENVDGEALAWAERRLLARSERRRVLVVISDGAPAEAATARANPPGLLDRHLAETIAAIQARGRLELRAIGIRHDVSRHYRHSVTIADAQMVGPALIAQLGAVFDSASPPKERRIAGQS